MTAQTAVSRGRFAAASLMVDTATVARPGGSVVYSGPIRLRQPTVEESGTLFGENGGGSQFVACLPHDTSGLRIGDIITMTYTGDPDLLDQSFRIVSVPISTFTLYKGYPCEAVG